MKDKILNILSPWNSNPLLYIIYNWKRDVTRFRIPTLHCLTMSRFVDPPALTCDVIYGCPLRVTWMPTVVRFTTNNFKLMENR